MGRGLPGTRADQDSPARRAHGEQPAHQPVTPRVPMSPRPFIHSSPRVRPGAPVSGRSHLQDGEAEVPEPVGDAVPKDSGPLERLLCTRHRHGSKFTPRLPVKLLILSFATPCVPMTRQKQETRRPPRHQRFLSGPTALPVHRRGRQPDPGQLPGTGRRLG
ncbi:hypothetical protein PAL_GLEAN10008126 [Pteropus alecto]|uniref:Uncharacterized protein n=1 Tax=Pteropus alecto TaxID=9402 RepID=L5K0H2_PTEAL|nr:hypothetical protein PAL_GLEAN10008126 [Pteropus alecto]